MSQLFIDIGATPNDGQGDPLRVAFAKINNNFSEVYTEISTASYAAGPAYAVQYKGPNTFTTIVYGHSIWVSFTVDGYSTSSDGIVWMDNPNPAVNIVRNIAVSPTGFIAVGDNGLIMTSDSTAYTWTIQTSGISYDLQCAYWDTTNNRFVVVGNGGTILTSPDGVTWTARLSGVSTNLYAVASNVNGYVAIGQSGVALFSVDSINWVAQSSGTAVDLYSIVSNGTAFVVVGANGTILTSVNGLTWVPQLSGTLQTFRSIARGVLGSTTWLIAVGSNGQPVRCSDGVGSTWVVGTVGASDPLVCIAYGAASFRTISSYGTMYYTTNATTWYSIPITDSFSGTSAFTFNDITNTLSVPTIATGNIAATGLIEFNAVGNFKLYGGSNNQILKTDGTGNLSWGNPASVVPGGGNSQVQFNDGGSFGGNSQFTFTASTGTVTANAFVANSFIGNLQGNADVANTVSNPSQPNITSLGTLSSLSVSGTVSSNVMVVDSLSANTAAISDLLSVTGNVTFNTSPNVVLGTVSNIHIYGGNAGSILTTDGTGNLEWNQIAATAGGSDTQIQYNDGGLLAGSANLTFDYNTNELTLDGTLGANTFQIGSGAFKFCTQRVYFATTTSTAVDQELWYIPAANVSAIDFTIIATDATDGTRQISKITASVLNTTVVFTEYAGLAINGGVGSFKVAYAPPDMVNPARILLLVSPDSSHPTTYNMLIVEYDL